MVGELEKFNNKLEEVVSWPDKDLNSLIFVAVNDFDKLESLRTHFAPSQLRIQGVFVSPDSMLSAYRPR